MLAQRIFSVALVLQTSIVMIFSADMDDCRYQFVEQPSNSILCNPYPTGRLVFKCAVEFSTGEGSPLHLAWYIKAHQESVPGSIRKGYFFKNTKSGIESELTIPLWSNSDKESAAAVFCQVSFSNGTVLSDSQKAYIYPQSVFKVNAVKSCGEETIHSARYQKCIGLDYPPPQRNIRSLTSITTAPTKTVIPLKTTTAKPPSRAPAINQSLTTVPSESAQLPTQVSPSSDNNSPNDIGWILEEQFLLFCAIGAACMLIIIVFVLLLCLCVLNRLCQQSGYCTCCV